MRRQTVITLAILAAALLLAWLAYSGGYLIGSR